MSITTSVVKHSRSTRLDITPVGLVHLIHLCKVVHIGQEHIDLDDLFDGCSCFLENSGKVLDALVL